jgi:hypothetical protein
MGLGPEKVKVPCLCGDNTIALRMLEENKERSATLIKAELLIPSFSETI